MQDFGGANDGRCEFSFLTRCISNAELYVTFGQHGGWTYRYCRAHAKQMLDLHDDAHVTIRNP